MSEHWNQDTTQPGFDAVTDSEPAELGDAVEEYLERAERTGSAPDLESFLAEYPNLGDDLKAALEGLAVVHGLLGSGGESRSALSGHPLKEPSTALKPGNSLAGYRIVRELGRGGMGVVYEAVHVDLDRPVALKVLRDWSGGSARRRFLNEAKTAASLHHTNIVPVFDVGQTDNTTYYAMQKIDGDGLDLIIRRRRGTVDNSAGGHASESETDRGASPDATAVIRTEVPGDSATARSGENSGRSGTGSSGLPKPRPGTFPAPGAVQAGSTAFARWVARVGYQAAMALDYAHNRQVVHRDVKPSNLILDRTGTIWVTDFGLALRLDDPGLSRGDGVLGTPRYTSPEQAARKVVDYRTDIYSLGVTLYELLTGVPAYDGESSDEVIRKILTEPPVPPRALDSTISRDLETIILKAMAHRAEDRYATAGELAEDLDRFLRYEPVKARRIGPIGRFSRLVRRHPAVSTVTAVAASIVLGVAIFAYRQVARERDDALLARTETLIALGGEKTALDKAKAAMRKQLWREASLVRMSAVPDRRRTILELVAEAAKYEPEAELQSKLRNEVVEALSMSDVRADAPLSFEPIADFEIMADQRRTVTISEDHRTMTVWDIDARKRRAEVLVESLFREKDTGRPRPMPDQGPVQPAGPGPGGPPPGRGPRDGPFGGLSRRFFRTIFSVGNTVGVVRPDGQGIVWIDPDTAEPRGEWTCPNGASIWDVRAIGNQARILTIEYHPSGFGNDATGRTVPQGIQNQNDEIVIAIHDLEDAEAKPLVLERYKFEPERVRFPLPVLSLSTDGDWVAMCRFFEDTIRVLDTHTGKELGNIAAQVPVTSIAAGPQRTLSVAGGGTIRLWRYELRQENGSTVLSTIALPSLGTNLGVVGKIRFAPTGNLIAASGTASGIELWDIDSGQAVATLGTGGPVSHLAFAANGSRMLAATADTKNGSLRVWNIEKPQVRSFVGSAPEMIVNMAAMGEAGNETVMIQGISGQMRFRTPQDSMFRKIDLPTPKSRVSAFRTDSSDRLWVMMDRGVQRFDAWKPGKPELTTPSAKFPLLETPLTDWSIRGFGLTRMFSGLVAAPKSKRVFTTRGPFLLMLDPDVSDSFVPVQIYSSSYEDPPPGGDRGRNDRRDTPDSRSPDGRPGGSGRGRPQSGRNIEPMSGFPGSRSPNPLPRRLSILPEGNGFVLLRGSSWEYWELGSLRESQAGKFWEANRRPPPSGAPTSDVIALSVSPDGRILALGTKAGFVTLVDLLTWRTLNVIAPDDLEDDAKNEIVDLKFDPNDPSFLGIVRQRAISFWCLRQEPRHFLDLPVELNAASPSPVIWNRSGTGLYLVESDGNIYFWDVSRVMETISEMKLR